MRVLLALTILQCVLSGSEANTLKTINKKRGDLKGDEIFRPIIDPVAASGRILRQDPEGYNYPIPSPSFLQPIASPVVIETITPMALLDPVEGLAAVESSAEQTPNDKKSPLLIQQGSTLMPQSPLGQMAQIKSLDVDCSKESMVVRLRFDRLFTGLIYSKGFHSNLDCHYVRYNSAKDFYEFTIRLNACGSQWVDNLATGGQAYLENVIIIQNEPGIQEMWDSSRSIRCFWEGNLQKTVTYAFDIDVLDTQVVSFSGDSATATMDIQLGKGPLAPSVNGLVKIGDTLTMVVAIQGDASFDVQVQNCIAHDGDRSNAVTLTDERGCVLKKKLMGPWQKSRNSNQPGVSIVAFSFFQAFKFPDQMEVFLECDVELCKNGCDLCPDDAPLFDLRGVRNRRQTSANVSDVSDVRLRRSLRVVSNEDIAYKPSVTLTTGNRLESEEDVCMSMSSFMIGVVMMLIILIISCLVTSLLCVKVRSAPTNQSLYPPSTFHAFSSSAYSKA